MMRLVVAGSVVVGAVVVGAMGGALRRVTRMRLGGMGMVIFGVGRGGVWWGQN